MSFVRPEARAALWRWREVYAAVGAVLAGLWMISGAGVLMDIPGYLFVAGGLLLGWTGIQRGRFRGPEGGTGAVQIDEGQVIYFGPLSGGSIALREMDSLILEGGMYPAHWRLDQAGQPPLLIPVNAAGAEALFDAFATLPGLKSERMLGLLRTQPNQSVVIWQRRSLRPEGALLH